MPPKHPRFAKYFLATLSSASISHTNQPAADTEAISGNATLMRCPVDLSEFSEGRVSVYIAAAGVAGSDLRIQASPDQVTWTNLDGSAGPELSMAATGMILSAWFKLAVAVRRDVILRVMFKDGDGVVDPRTGIIMAEFR